MYTPLEPGFSSDSGATGKLFLLIYYNVYLSHISNSSLIMSHKKKINKIPKKTSCRGNNLQIYFGNFGLRNGCKCTPVLLS